MSKKMILGLTLAIVLVSGFSFSARRPIAAFVCLISACPHALGLVEQ